MYRFDVLFQTAVFHVFFSTFVALEFVHDVLLFDVPPKGLRLVVFFAADQAHEAAAIFIGPKLRQPPQKLSLRHLLLQIHH